VNDSIACQVCLHDLVWDEEQLVTQLVRVLLNLAALSIRGAVRGASHPTGPTVSLVAVVQLILLAGVQEHDSVLTGSMINHGAGQDSVIQLLYFNDVHNDSSVFRGYRRSSVRLIA
jgi:hypothetical protein